MTGYVVRRATGADVPAMVGLRREAERWLAERGIEQWTTRWAEVGDEKLHRAARQGRAWIIETHSDVGSQIDSEGGRDAGDDADRDVAGTVTLGGPDEDLWRVEDGPALYLYKLIIGRRHAGLGIGALVLDWACDQAARYGYPWLRLDVWPTNPGLQDYYRAHGFAHVRTVHVPGRDTGALFQRPAARTPTTQLIQPDP